MSDNAVAALFVAVIPAYFLINHFIDAWRDRGIVKFKAFEAQNRAVIKAEGR